MNKATPLAKNLLLIGIPVALLSVLILIMTSSYINGNDTLSLAITIDLLLTVPLVYFFIIRKLEIPKTTVIPVMILGLVIGYYFLPEENHNYLDLFKNYVLPFVELFVLTFVIIKVRKTVKTYQELKVRTPDFLDTLKNVCLQVFPERVVPFVASEVAVFYYGFINWKKRTLQSNEFSYHKKSTTQSIMIAVIMLIAIETVWLHLVLAKWNPIAAWILTGLSVYSAFQVFGFARALSKRPISLDEDTLTLRYGIMNETRIPYNTIESIELSTSDLEKNKLTRTLSPLGELESHNTVIHLKKKNALVGLYGSQKQFTILGLHVDEASKFKEELEKVLS